MSPERLKKLEELLDAIGASERIRREERQEGRQEGVQEFVALLKSGYSVDEAKEKMLLQNA